MKIAIISSLDKGTASFCLPFLAENSKIDIKIIILANNRPINILSKIRIKVKKIFRIGISGFIISKMIQNWLRQEVQKEFELQGLNELANKYNIRFEHTPEINSHKTIDLLKESGAEIGISLGNSYINKKVFQSLEKGIINLHHDLLPEYRGAQSIIWHIYEGSLICGFTIHQIDTRIDTGNIIYSEQLNIEIKPKLSETVAFNYARLLKASAIGLVKVINNYAELKRKEITQGKGRSYNSPNLMQYLWMLYQNRLLYRRFSNIS